MKKIFIDTDCGVDDALAIGIALAHPQLEVVGVSTVSGTVVVTQVSDNVLRLLPVLGRNEIPVYQGASRPLVAQSNRDASVLVRNGLGGVTLPDIGKKIEDLGAPEGLLRQAQKNPGLTLVALGPFTNIAIALNLFPELETLIGGIVCMGGALGPGNVTPHAEFNFYTDPESVQAVLESKVPLTVVLWDAAIKITHSEEEIRSLELEQCRAGKLFLDMHEPMFVHREKVYGARMARFPDPSTMAYVVNPALAREVLMGNLVIEPTHSARRGACTLKSGERVSLITEIDKTGFRRILMGIRNLA
jgi:inosine-uridine nucleoside N-ribohydrolase